MESVGPDDLLAEHQILRDADELFLEGNTCERLPNTRHISITAGFSLIRRLKPKRTWIVHYSGHEDPWGPLSHRQLQDWIDDNKGASTNGCAGRDIRVAHHGMTVAF